MSDSAASASVKKGYRFGDYLLKPAAKLLHQVASATAVPVLTSLTNSSPEDPYYVGKLIHQVASATAVPVLTSLTNSSPEDPYYFGKLTKQIAPEFYDNYLNSNKLYVVAQKNTYSDLPVDYFMLINRPYADHTSIGIIRDSGNCVVHVNVDTNAERPYTEPVVIPDIVDDKITTAVYEDPRRNTKESPHYAVAMIIGDRMLAIVWVDKTRYFVDLGYYGYCPIYALIQTVYKECIRPNPKSDKCMKIYHF